jgi:prevent-host-death family protein
MVSISVSELKARLSEHLRRVKAGETVVVTERGRAVAQISPPVLDEDAELQRLVDQGVIRRGRGSIPPGFWERPRPADPEGKVLEALLEGRRDR